MVLPLTEFARGVRKALLHGEAAELEGGDVELVFRSVQSQARAR
jgi:hypothetical protein|eukprot:COSAG01_NODE_8987_length_2592_cov_2.970718_3_plen_44_part_00